MQVTADALLRLRSQQGDEILGEHDLQQGAATAAAKDLATNWQANVRDEKRGPVQLKKLISDVDEVIAILEEWKERVRQSATDGTFSA